MTKVLELIAQLGRCKMCNSKQLLTRVKGKAGKEQREPWIRNAPDKVNS